MEIGMRIKVQDKTVWHRWFAWYPLWSQDKKEYVFWEYIEVRAIHGVYDDTWEYRYDG